MMTFFVGLLWFTSLIGMLFSLLVSQYIGAATMLMNLILATIMLVERLEK